MPPVQVLLVFAAAAAIYMGGKTVGHGVKVGAVKVKHAIVHVVTLGKK
jgi:hypothetical protein